MQDSYLCSDCPRACGVSRTPVSGEGVCKSPSLPVVARAMPHFGEEPCISGARGSGAIFFCGCGLRCVFCQNREISRDCRSGKVLTPEQLRQIILNLKDRGVHNINMVTATHFTKAVSEALDGLELGIPVVWNSSGYESADTLRMLEGKVQVYMPDFKYSDSALAGRYSRALDYPEIASRAIAEMYRQTGPVQFDSQGMLTRGVLIRHLMLPGMLDNTLGVIDAVSSLLPRGSFLFSLMRQYTPLAEAREYPELMGHVTDDEYDGAVSYMELCGIDNGFLQEAGSCGTEAIPEFDLSGLE